ncbi:MAG: ABC transporter substrate-binding protein [Limnochordales bacterium]|nr:ABC transporter substrate-binding protein [Limnochordales bacterium]
MVLVAFLLAGLALFSSEVWAAQTIKIGVVGPLSGDSATYGISVKNAVELYFKEVNAKGGIRGVKIDVIALDDKGDASEAVNAVRRLITRDQVAAIIGTTTSGPMRAAAPIANSMKVPMLSPTATQEGLTDIGPYIFRTCFVDDFQGKVMAKFAREELKISRVAILYENTDTYSKGLANSFKEYFTKLGGMIVAEEAYGKGDQDFSAQLTRIRRSGAQAIYTPVYYTAAGLIAKQARQLGVNLPLLGPDGFDSDQLLEIGGDAIVGSYFTNHYSPLTKDPLAVEFQQKYRAAYGKTPDALAALAWDAAAVMADAIERALARHKVSDLQGVREGIRQALSGLKDFHGVTGYITFDENRDPIKTALILRVTKNGHEIVTSIKP